MNKFKNTELFEMKSLIIFILVNYVAGNCEKLYKNKFNYACFKPKCLAKDPDFVINIFYENCEGKDQSNYTVIGAGTLADDCLTLKFSALYLVSGEKKGEKYVNGLQSITRSQEPMGGKHINLIIRGLNLLMWLDLAYRQIQGLLLVTSGPLQGKYIYLKTIYLSAAYLKKCSSVLGYSYVSSKSSVLLIVEKLDLNAFIAPTGGYEVFRKSATTICQGKFYLFWI